MRKTAVLVVLCLSFSVFGFAEKKFPLTGTLVSPAFVGTADVGVDRNNGNARFKIKAELLAPPEKLTPPMAGYLVWFQEPGGNPESQGRIGDDKKQSEELTIHSGSRTITLQSGESWSRTMTAGDFSRGMLTAHNNIRAEMKLPLLQWSSELAAYSQKWANALIAKGTAVHNSKSPYGENILVTGLGSTPSSVVTEWASESQNYTYRSNACDGDCGHYTQLVWRSTREVGCGMAHNGQREIWVCSYDPRGNFRGERPY